MQVTYIIYQEKMILPKNKHFADKKEDSHRKAKGAALIGGGLAVSSGIGRMGDLISEKSGNYFGKSTLNAEDAKSIGKKLIDQAKKNGGPKIIEDSNFQNSAYLGGKSGKILRGVLTKLKKKSRSSGNKSYEKAADKIKGEVKKIYGDKVTSNLGKDTIIMGRFKDADVLVHELGHSNYQVSGRSKSIIGKAAHKGYGVSSIATNTSIGKLGVAANGFHSGLKSAKLKADGKKESTWNKVRAAAVPAVLAAPLLVSEGKASLNGLKNMKKLGASKELMKESRKKLGAAWGTYAGGAVKNIALGKGSRLVGKGVGSLIYKKKEDDTTKK